jgi:hypothetical protein
MPYKEKVISGILIDVANTFIIWYHEIVKRYKNRSSV